MGRLTEILTRGQAFVRGLSWALRQEQGESDLVCSWVFNTCMELADLAAKGQQAATRAEFLNLARRSVRLSLETESSQCAEQAMILARTTCYHEAISTR